MTRGARVGNQVPSLPAGLFRTRLDNCSGGMDTSSPLSSRGKWRCWFRAFRGTNPTPWCGRAAHPVGSWAPLPSKTAQANSSLCLQWGGELRASLPGDWLPKFSWAQRNLVCGSVLMLQPVWQERCRSCTGHQLSISFYFALAEGDTPPLPSIHPEVMESLGRGFGMKLGFSASGVLLPIGPGLLQGLGLAVMIPKMSSVTRHIR